MGEDDSESRVWHRCWSTFAGQAHEKRGDSLVVEGMGILPLVRADVPDVREEAIMGQVRFLGVVPQEIVVIDCCSADGRSLVEAGMRSMPVVLVVEG